MVTRMEPDRRNDEERDDAAEPMRSDAEKMQEHVEDLGERIESAKSDWRSKQQDNETPGARPPSDDEGDRSPSKPT